MCTMVFGFRKINVSANVKNIISYYSSWWVLITNLKGKINQATKFKNNINAHEN